jgi:hypothetical protein
MRRTLGIALDPLGRNPLPTPPLNRLINDHDHRAFRHGDVKEQSQQPAARCERRLLGPVEHAVVVLEMRIGAFPQYTQHDSHGAFAWSKNRAHE